MLGGEGEIIIKRVVKYFLVSVIIAAGLLFTAIPLGATNAEDVVSPAAIVEQRSHRLLSYSSADTPEEQVRYWLQRFYVDPVSESVLNAESIDEMIRLLNDPYTCFLTPEQYNSFISPGQSGIGIYMEGVPQGILVKSLILGSPAEEGGVQPGDIIIMVKEHLAESWTTLAGFSADQGGSLIRGPAGSRVDLTVIRGNELLYFTLTREKIEPPPVVASLPDPDIALLELNTFLNNENKPATPALFSEALQDMESQCVKGYILDLRDNSGGYVDNALKIAGFFIGEQRAMLVRPPVTSETAQKQELLITKPTVVLINQNTASASEILSGALQDYNCALFLGQKTYGKGCMQSICQIYNQGELYGYLKITTARFYTPLGHTVDRVGVVPDICIDLTDPMLAARLLLSATALTENNTDSSVVKLINGSQEYGIDLNRAQEQEYWPVFKEIINNVNSAYFMLPGHTGWVQASPEQVQAKWPLYYPGYHPFPVINKHPGEPVTIIFSHPLDPASVHEQSVELREKASGKSIGLNFQLIDSDKLQLIPQRPLQSGHDYWLTVHPGARGVCSHEQQLTLSKGYITTIVVP